MEESPIAYGKRNINRDLKIHELMKKSQQKFVAFACALFLQLGLFASSVHAADHPFHVQDDLCASFINFGHQDLKVDAALPEVGFRLISVEKLAEDISPVYTSVRPVYSSRAPPSHR